MIDVRIERGKHLIDRGDRFIAVVVFVVVVLVVVVVRLIVVGDRRSNERREFVKIQSTALIGVEPQEV